MDLIRSAVGDAKLTYLGKSYGTELGAVYADEFPTKVRALVLDGALPPGLGVAGQSREQGMGFEGDLRDFLADCVAHTSCPFSGTAAHARTQFDAFLAAVAAQALPTQLGRPLAIGNAVNGVTAALYNTGELAGAAGGPGSGAARRRLASAVLLRLLRRAAHRPVRVVGQCRSRHQLHGRAEPRSRSPQVAAYAKSWAVDAPLYGPLEAWGLLTCNGWLPTATRLPDRVTAKGRPRSSSSAPPATRPPPTPGPPTSPTSSAAAGWSPTSGTATRCTGAGAAAASTRPSTTT